MKRSDMAQIIWLAINELEDGDHILKRIEEAGMLPPMKELTVTRLNGEYVGKQLTFTWEPEDDGSSNDD